LNFFV